jgi:hypothetical protein
MKELAMRKKDRLPPFVPILKATIKSESFKRLTNASRVAYLLLKSQCCRFDQTDVILPYSHAEQFMHRGTWKSSIRQLQKEGYIAIEQKGGLFRRTNVYRLLM